VDLLTAAPATSFIPLVTFATMSAMPQQLTNEERYVIAYLKSDRVGASRWGWFAAQCVAAGIFAYGFFGDDRAMIFTGFARCFCWTCTHLPASHG
jgi:hypothetical protein